MKLKMKLKFLCPECGKLMSKMKRGETSNDGNRIYICKNNKCSLIDLTYKSIHFDSVMSKNVR